ncbi:MAG TPA: hypothetical protein VMU55_06795 [Solirubrobacteraceae bacterium]|nr:hypothetical protein [Solirubrobacteraceae bacterium]
MPPPVKEPAEHLPRGGAPAGALAPGLDPGGAGARAGSQGLC